MNNNKENLGYYNPQLLDIINDLKYNLKPFILNKEDKLAHALNDSINTIINNFVLNEDPHIFASNPNIINKMKQGNKMSKDGYTSPIADLIQDGFGNCSDEELQEMMKNGVIYHPYVPFQVSKIEIKDMERKYACPHTKSVSLVCLDCAMKIKCKS